MKKGKRSFNLSCVSLKNVDLKKKVIGSIKSRVRKSLKNSHLLKHLRLCETQI